MSVLTKEEIKTKINQKCYDDRLIITPNNVAHLIDSNAIAFDFSG
jgi:SepF-like predicted cell division protein (DUF552 family)